MPAFSALLVKLSNAADARARTIVYLTGRWAAERWFEENDPEGVAFEYDVLE
jgi:hypothetical protein